MSGESKRDWEKTWIHAAFGVVAGAGVGFYCGQNAGWAAGGAVVIGFLAAVYLDDFWEWLGGWW